MFFDQGFILETRKRSKKKRNILHTKMEVYYTNPDFIPEHLLLSLGWIHKGVFYSRNFNWLLFFTFLYFLLFFFNSIFFYFILFQWYVYYALIYGEIDSFVDKFVQNINPLDQYSSKTIFDEDIWSFWIGNSKSYLARAHLLFNIHFSIVPVMNCKLLRYNNKFQFLFLSNFNIKNVNFYYFYKYLKLTFLKSCIEKNKFFIYFSENLIYVKLKKKTFMKNIFINYLNNKKFKSIFLFNTFFNNMFLFKNKILIKIFFCFFNIKNLIKNKNFFRGNIYINLESKFMKFSLISFNKYIFNFYNLKYKNIKTLKQISHFSIIKNKKL